MQRSDSKQDRNLDVLRAIAVLLVVSHHGLQMNGVESFKVGRYGVLIFFVHTSLVLMMSLSRTIERQSKIVVPFYIQRAFRIYPLSILCVLSVVAFHVPAAPFEPAYFRPSAFKLVSNLLLIQNSGVGSVSAPLWSLPYEVQMYILLPFLYFFVQRFRSLWAMLFLLSISILLGSIQFLTPLGKVAQFFPCFMAGILAFWLRRVQTGFLPAALWPIFVLGLGAAFLTITFPGDAFVACILIGATLGLFQEPSPSLWTRSAHEIAKYSYGIYLAHEPLYWLCFHKLPIHSPVLQWVAFVTLLAAVPFTLFHLVESPMIRLGKKLTSVRRVEVAEATSR